MTAIIITLCIILLVVVILQIGKVSEVAGRIKGAKAVQEDANFWHSRISIIFMIVFLVAVVWATYYYRNFMFGYGPHESASQHGLRIDFSFHITLIITSIVFFATQFLLFYFTYRFRQRRGKKAKFIPYNNTLEIIWTAIPALVLGSLAVYGVNTWMTTMKDITDDEDVIEIEATGMQYAWLLRYPGADGEFGRKNYRDITGINPLGQDWTDEAGLDDFQPDKIVLPVGKKVRVTINSRDVLHSFFLPHFRVKMDAVPGIPTYFVFTPIKTTEEYKQELRKYKEYQKPSNPDDPSGPKLWETFQYELACAEICGSGHFSMKKIVEIVTEEEYEEWLASQTSYYESSIKGTKNDPNYSELPTPDKDLDVEDAEIIEEDSLDVDEDEMGEEVDDGMNEEDL